PWDGSAEFAFAVPPKTAVAPTTRERLAIREVEPAGNAGLNKRVQNLRRLQILRTDWVGLLHQLHRFRLYQRVQTGLTRCTGRDLTIGGELKSVVGANSRGLTCRRLDIYDPTFFIQKIDDATDGNPSDFTGDFDLNRSRLNPGCCFVHVFG